MTGGQCIEEIKNAFNTMDNNNSSNEVNEGPDSPADLMSDNEVEEASPTRAKKKAQKLPKLILCTSALRYNVIKRVCRKMDFKLMDDENADWDIYWSDVGV